MPPHPAVPFLDLNRQIHPLQSDLENAFRKVTRNGSFILGPEVRSFEAEFARFCSVRYGIGVASGTDALELSLRALGIGSGDRVATVSFTFMATVDAIRQVGAEPLFVDIDPSTYTLDPKDLERKISTLSRSERSRLKAVLPVHLYGHPADMEGIGRIARRYRLKIVEDAAQAAGAFWKGRPVGSFGTAACFSFFPTKNLGGLGDAGLILTSSRLLDQRLRSLRIHGRSNGELQKVLGRNSRLDELQAAFLRVKLRRLKGWVNLRRFWAAEYTRRLSRVAFIGCPVQARGARHVFHLYVIRSPRRERIRKVLEREGIASRVYYERPVHRQPLHWEIGRRFSLPQTDRACREVLALPLFPELQKKELVRVCEVIASVKEKP